MAVCKRAALFALCLLLTLCVYASETGGQTAGAKGETVRVGWYESPFNITDKFGRRSGYAYEYQQKIAAYTGWNYEYVEGSWPELYQMLLDGDIDLMSDISYTEERAEKMLFASYPMGAEQYYVCVSTQRDSDISAENLNSFNGKKIGVSKESFQEGLFRDWVAQMGLDVEIVELMTGESENIALVDSGELDAYVSIDSYGGVHNLMPVVRIGSSDYFFALSNNRRDLLPQLESALEQIYNESRYYNQFLQEKYLDSLSISFYCTREEVDWLSGHGKIRVGCEDDYLPFCALDAETGEVTGALTDFFHLASAVVNNAELPFEAVPFPTILDAMEALNRGEIDCIFPVAMDTYDAEEYGVLNTTTCMHAEMYVSVRSAYQRFFSLEDDITVAIEDGDVNYTTFLMDYFPNWKYVYYESKEACCQAVYRGYADCVLTCNYRLNLNKDLFEKYGLATISTGRAVSFSFAVDRQSERLYSILNKAINFVRDSTIDASLATHSYVDKGFTFQDFLRANMFAILGVAMVIFLVIITLLIKSRRAERKAKQALRDLRESLGREEKQKKELKATKKKAYVDPLTGVKNKNAYVEASDSLQRRITDGLEPEFTVAVFDVNDLKRVNDVEGHEAGDRHIKNASMIICDVFKRSPVFRIGGDEFMAILEGSDYENREELETTFNQIVDDHKEQGLVVVSAGFADFDPESDSTFKEVFQRADLLMYERKRFLKGGREIR